MMVYNKRKVKIKTVEFFRKVEKIQNHIKNIIENRKLRYKLVMSCIEKKQSFMLMKGKKQKKLVKQLGSISVEIKHQVVMRYLRYCQDQNVYLNLLYRKKAKEAGMLLKAHYGHKIMSSYRKNKDIVKMKPEQVAKSLETDPEELGPFVSALPPCLDNCLTEKERKEAELMRVRFLDIDDPIFIAKDEELTV
jgi:hypothetical protein